MVCAQMGLTEENKVNAVVFSEAILYLLEEQFNHFLIGP